MSILVFADTDEGRFKKSSLEAVSYGKGAADRLNTDLVVCAAGKLDENELKKTGTYGAGKVLHVDHEKTNTFSTEIFTAILQQAGEKTGADTFILPGGFNSSQVASALAAKLSAGIVSNVIELPDNSDGFTVKKGVFSGKGYGTFRITPDKRVLTVGNNAYGLHENPVEVNIEKFTPELDQEKVPYTSKEVSKMKGKTPLPDCEIVVSGGRGLKGPENWHLIEDFAEAIGGGTACSKPVADMDWRPHHEHVGQTGTTISPNLYVAVGISGAVQHLAGVSSSKVIVVINKDPEAPFFKAADYGVVGDAFEVMPRLIEAAKKQKATS